MMADRYPLAWSTLGSPSWSFEHTVEQAAQSGYRALEVRVLDGEIIPSNLSAERRRQMKQAMKAHNIEIVALGLSTRFSAVDAAERQTNLEELRRYLELANDLGAPMVRTFGGNVQPGQSLEQTIDWVAENLNAAAPAAEAQGVTILLETHDAFCKGEDVAKVLAQVSSPRVMAVWDVHHPFRMGETIEETWRLLGSRVQHIHLKDARKRADGSWQLVLLGQGEVPCRPIVELLHRNGYRGYISAEWEKKWHPEVEEPEIALPQHAQVMREWFTKLA